MPALPAHPLLASNRPAAKRTSVLVVDDSPFMQRRLIECIESVPDLYVAGRAENGLEAIRLAETLVPDVITMDIQMPKMDGLHAIEYIMRSNPRPIVVVSSYTRKNSQAALYALNLGVVDIIEKPSAAGVSLDLSLQAWEIVAKLRTAARVRVIRTVAPSMSYASKPKPTQGAPLSAASLAAASPPTAGTPSLIAIGSSTGGPVALRELFASIPSAAFPPVLVTQHLPERFTKELAMQLDAISAIRVVEAAGGELPQAGMAYIAPGGKHMEIDAQGCIKLTMDAPVHHCRPSVDNLFLSLARHGGPRVLAMVLTGMGEDGAAGAVALKRAGATVIAQDEESCIVFGMPRAVIEAGAAHHVLSLDSLKSLLSRAGKNLPATPLCASLYAAAKG